MKCPICNQTKWHEYLNKLSRCNNCGFIRAKDKYFKIDPTKLYSSEFFSSEYGDYTKEQNALEKNFVDRIKRIRKYKSHGKLLEIGCAHGYFLIPAQKYFQCSGIDLNPSVTAVAKKNTKAKIFTGDFLIAKLRKNYYDVVCLFDTIEHLKDPEKYLQKVSQVLKPDGIVVIETGDIGSILARVQGNSWRLIFPPHHLQYFSKSSLTKLLANTGFKTKEVNLVSFYRTLRQTFYRLTNNKWFLNSKLKVLSLPISVNTFDLLFVIAQKVNP